MAGVRPSYVRKALGTAPELAEVITELTFAEALKALDIEAGGRRRKNSIRRLIGRVVATESEERRQKLLAKYLR